MQVNHDMMLTTAKTQWKRLACSTNLSSFYQQCCCGFSWKSNLALRRHPCADRFFDLLGAVLSSLAACLIWLETEFAPRSTLQVNHDMMKLMDIF